MKKIFKSILAVSVICLTSCTGLLDMTPTDKVSDKVIWESTQNAEYSINYIYSYIIDVTQSQSLPPDTLTLIWVTGAHGTALSAE